MKVESLEPRTLLAGDLVINEFMAVNQSTLADVDGEYSDWFEIHNTSGSPINLDGYFATDDEDDLTRWRFPAVTVPAGGYRLIFASGKDRTNPAAELHTNFSLSSDGEFFAIVRPDGSTIEHAYAPAYPPQLANVSYGLLEGTTVTDALIDEGASLKTHVPSSGSLGTTWTGTQFDDTGWSAGNSGVGYDIGIGAPVFALIDIGGSSGRSEPGSVPQGQIGLAADTSGPLPTTSLTSSSATGSVPFTIAIGNGNRGGSIDWRDRGNSSSSDALAWLAEDHVKNNNGFVEVTLGGLPAGSYTITSYHTDLTNSQCEAIRVFVNGAEQVGVLGRSNFNFVLSSITTAEVESTSATFTVESNGTDAIRILFDGSAASDREVPLAGLKLIANGPLYEGLVETSLQAAMFGQQTSAYVRAPFTVVDAAAVQSLRLHMQYDDGFVAYLNGTEVARRNAPLNVSFNSAAASDRTDGNALTPESIDLSNQAHLLVNGGNLLAIHGLNDAAGSARFLLAPQLEAEVYFDAPRQYFTTATPAAANVQGVLGVVADTQFSVERGFFEAPFQVALTTATTGAQIRYTLDGTAPTATTGMVYSGPISIGTTATLRAAAYRPGYLASNVDTQTYIFLADVIRQNGAGLPTNWGHAGPDYAMDQEIVNDPRYSSTIIDDLKSIPSLSLVMNQDDWFGAGGQGIYIQGTGSPRAVSAEWINGDGTDGFQINASVQIQGGSSTDRWKTDKLSMRLKFKAPYGPTKLEYPLFGEGAADEFDSVILDAVLNYSWLHNFDANQRNQAKYIQDQIVADLQNAAGSYGPHGTYAHLYLNGIYWGMYYVHERPDESFAESYLGGDKDDYDIIKHNSGTVVNGSNANYTAMLAAAAKDLTVPANYQALLNLLDVEDFIDYMIVNLYMGNSDWAHHNWYASFNRVDPNGRWRFHSWDAEHVLTNVNQDVSNRNDAGGPTRIHQQLRANSEYRQLFADHVQRHLFGDGILTPAAVAATYQARMNEVDRAIVGESARWGDNRVTVPFTQDHWLATQQDLFINYFPQRTAIVLAQFRTDGLFPALAAPVFSQAGGIVPPGFALSMSASSNIYYTLDGTDPRLEGGSLNPAAVAYTGNPAQINQRSSVRARTYNGSQWSALSEAEFYVNVPAAAGNLAITEINYNPYQPTSWEPGVIDNNDFEFIELQNISNNVIDLDGVRFGSGIEFVFSGPSVSSLLPGQFVVIVKNPAAFQARYGTGVAVAGVFASGSLSSSGELLEVLDRFGSLIQSFEYEDSGDWPGRADGNGSTLEVKNPAGDASDPDNWRSSGEFHGSPGFAGIGPVTDVLVNEVLTHTDLPQYDSIELYNTTASAIDVSHWWLSDDNSDYFKFQIPAGTILPAGGYLVFDARDFNASGGVNPSDFGLDAAHGDSVYLVAAGSNGRPTRLADAVDFIAAPNGESFGRWPNGSGELFPMTAVTLGTANSGPRFGPLLISEVMYHPADPDGTGPRVERDVEFVEIYNSTSASVTLTDWAIGGGVDFAFAPGTVLPGRTALVVVSFDPALPANAARLATFRAAYGIDASVVLVGGYTGSLNNAGERIRLLRPDEPPNDEPTFTPLLLEDEANYSDTTPWPTEPDGSGTSLTRRAVDWWGNDPAGWLSDAPTPGLAFPTRVVARHLFYNGSSFDGDAGASPGDDFARATTKQPVLPGFGPATVANFSNYLHGITGIMIDIAQLPPEVTLAASDFSFRMGNENNTGNWAAAPSPSSITVRRGAGHLGSDRVTLIWPAGSIVNTWLQVRVKAGARTGLAADDLFYFGNAVADATGDGTVNASDFAAVRANPRSFLDPATVDSLFDLDHDGRVNAADLAIVRDHAGVLGGGLMMLTPSGSVPLAAKSPHIGAGVAFMPDLQSMKQPPADEVFMKFLVEEPEAAEAVDHLELLASLPPRPTLPASDDLFAFSTTLGMRENNFGLEVPLPAGRG